MAIVSIDQVKEGAVLAKDVKNDAGQILVPQGMTLLEKHIDRLKNFGVTQIEIVGPKREELDAMDPALVKKAEEEVTPLFKFNSLDDEWIKKLFRLAVYHKALKIKATGAK